MKQNQRPGWKPNMDLSPLGEFTQDASRRGNLVFSKLWNVQRLPLKDSKGPPSTCKRGSKDELRRMLQIEEFTSDLVQKMEQRLSNEDEENIFTMRRSSQVADQNPILILSDRNA